MGISIQISDEHFGKTKLPIFKLEYPSESVTVQEIIARRVEEEVAHVNHMKNDPDRIKAEHRMFLAGLTKQSPEILLNPQIRKRSGNLIDVDAAVATALKAFKSGHFFVLFNDKQYEHLDQTVQLIPDSEVIFLRLTPLMGG